MAKLRFTITMSLDGYVAGPNQSRENPPGEGASGLHDWGFATRTFRSMHGLEGGETGLDDEHAARAVANVGAAIMGRNMFEGAVSSPAGSMELTDAGFLFRFAAENCYWGAPPGTHRNDESASQHDRG